MEAIPLLSNTWIIDSKELLETVSSGLEKYFQRAGFLYPKKVTAFVFTRQTLKSLNSD